MKKKKPKFQLAQFLNNPKYRDRKSKEISKKIFSKKKKK